MLEFTSLVIILPIEMSSGLINLTGMPSMPEAFLLSRPFIMKMTSNFETSDSVEKLMKVLNKMIKEKLMWEEDY